MQLSAEPAQPVTALSLLGTVDSFGAARVLVDAGESADGPWRRVGKFRALGAPMQWQRLELGAKEPARAATAARYYRLYVRREGHATFRHAIHGVRFHCGDGGDDER